MVNGASANCQPRQIAWVDTGCCHARTGSLAPFTTVGRSDNRKGQFKRATLDSRSTQMLKWKSNCVQLVIGPKIQNGEDRGHRKGKRIPHRPPRLSAKGKGGATLGHNFHPIKLDTGCATVKSQTMASVGVQTVGKGQSRQATLSRRSSRCLNGNQIVCSW